jgi:hypothetical protein
MRCLCTECTKRFSLVLCCFSFAILDPAVADAMEYNMIIICKVESPFSFLHNTRLTYRCMLPVSWKLVARTSNVAGVALLL